MGVQKDPIDGQVSPAEKSVTPTDIQIPLLTGDEQKRAAELIQRTFRGHRARREIKGHGLDASTRWVEVVRDAKYQQLTTPRPPDEPTPAALERWGKVTDIARHAGADDSSDSDASLSDASYSDYNDISGVNQKQSMERKRIAKERRRHTAKQMDLQYWLEMVDQKHRYGSNLRKYHAYWKSQNTDQNFFYWLDYGDGKTVDLEECSRERLDKEQVRYLSREERLNYLVKVDGQGHLIWAKNGEKVWTKDELYRDSVKGIVPTDDSAPKWTPDVRKQNSAKVLSEDASDSDSDSDSEEEIREAQESGKEGERYVNEEFHRAKGPAKLKHVSAAVLFNHMIRQSLKKGHKWIFVADTSFHLYIGYKQSGAFQHSSFLYGSRILSAGLIKVKDGQLRRLSPLSGHYRPPAANFRSFVHTLEEEGVDMSRVSISRSYAILVGLEGYVKTRRKIKKAEKAVTHQVDKVVRPEKVKAEEEAAQDHSKSAQREREHLEKERLAELERKHSPKESDRSIGRRLSNAWNRLTGRPSVIENKGVAEERGTPGTGPEDGLPPPDGGRHFPPKATTEDKNT